MTKSEQIGELAGALAKAQLEFDSVPKDSEVEVRGETKAGKPYSYKYNYSDLTTIIACTRPALNKHGLSFTQGIIETDKGLLCETTLVHSSGQWISNTCPMVVAKKENEMQAIGAAFTFAKRYGYSAIVGISSDEDTDANAQPFTKHTNTPAPGNVKPSQGPMAGTQSAGELSQYVIQIGTFKGEKLGEIFRDDLYQALEIAVTVDQTPQVKEFVDRVSQYLKVDLNSLRKNASTATPGPSVPPSKSVSPPVQTPQAKNIQNLRNSAHV